MNENATTVPTSNSVIKATANTENANPPDSSFPNLKAKEDKPATLWLLFLI